VTKSKFQQAYTTGCDTAIELNSVIYVKKAIWCQCEEQTNGKQLKYYDQSFYYDYNETKQKHKQDTLYLEDFDDTFFVTSNINSLKHFTVLSTA